MQFIFFNVKKIKIKIKTMKETTKSGNQLKAEEKD